MKWLTGFCIFFLLLLLFILSLIGKQANFEFVPFLGQVSYFCSPTGVKYMIFHESKTAVPLYDTNGHVIICLDE